MKQLLRILAVSVAIFAGGWLILGPRQLYSAERPSNSPPVISAPAQHAAGQLDPATADPATIAAAVNQNRLAWELAWTVGAGLLVLLMQAGFAMVETGLTRSKNVTHTMSMCLMSYGIGVLAYYAVGFALMYGGAVDPGAGKQVSLQLFGHDFGIVGRDGFFLAGRAADFGLLAFFMSQAVMTSIAATIPTGALAERWKFRSFVWFSIVVSAIIYPVFGHWVWGGGWLAKLGTNFGLGHGAVDFAGSSVIHMVGGVAAAAGCKALGSRIGKYNRDGSMNVLLAHSVPMYMVGTLLLAVGWFALNAGRAMAGGDLIVGRVAANTLLASAAGAVAAMIYMGFFYRKPDPSFMCNGLLAGLAAISGPCAYVTPTAAVLIGAIAGVLVVTSVLFLERHTRLDDPVGAISVHGVNGAWGILAVGLFADGSYGHGLNGRFWYKMADGKLTWFDHALQILPTDWAPRGVAGLFHGDASQLAAQCVSLLANLIWVSLASYVALRAIGALIGNRVGATTEYQGLDIPELGVVGYVTEDPMSPKGGVSRPPAEPRAAVAPPLAAQMRFGVSIEGADAAAVKAAWNELCQPTEGSVDPDFAAVYPNMTLLKGARFRFSGGEPEDIRGRLERLLNRRLPNRSIRAKLEP